MSDVFLDENKDAGQLPAVINFPFKKEHVNYISINMWVSPNGKNTASGYVDFKNGNTSGRQDFTGDDIDIVALKIKAFINQLK
jgi:hypothetical protein